MFNDDSLLSRMKDRIRDSSRYVDLPDVVNKQHKLYPTVTMTEMEDAERKLGFRLPELLRKLYLQVGNGGFGPGYGLLALNENGAKNYHSNLVDGYLDLVNKNPGDTPPWPKYLITLCDWGDGITSLMSAASQTSPVLRFRGDQYPYEGPWEQVMSIEALSLHVWLDDWLRDRPLFDRSIS